MQKWIRYGMALVPMLLHSRAWANVAEGLGSDIPVVTQAVQLHEALFGVGIPLVLGLCLIVVLVNVGLGYMRIGSGLGRVLFVVFLGGFGITGILTMFGLDTALAAMR